MFSDENLKDLGFTLSSAHAEGCTTAECAKRVAMRAAELLASCRVPEVSEALSAEAQWRARASIFSARVAVLEKEKANLCEGNKLLTERHHSAEESVRELTRRAQQAEALLERERGAEAVWKRRVEVAAEELADVGAGEFGRLDIVGRVRHLKGMWSGEKERLGRCHSLIGELRGALGQAQNKIDALSAGGQAPSEHVDRARSVCERVFYWLSMGDEGPESDLPCPEEIAELPKPIAELLEEARVAARGLGGLKDEDENHARYPRSATCTHDDAAKPGHPERVKERSEAVRRAAQCYAPKHMNCPCGWDPPQTCHYPTPDGEPTEAAWKEAHELQKAHDRGAEAMRAACWEAVQEWAQGRGLTREEQQSIKSAIEGATP